MTKRSDQLARSHRDHGHQVADQQRRPRKQARAARGAAEREHQIAEGDLRYTGAIECLLRRRSPATGRNGPLRARYDSADVAGPGQGWPLGGDPDSTREHPPADVDSFSADAGNESDAATRRPVEFRVCPQRTRPPKRGNSTATAQRHVFRLRRSFQSPQTLSEWAELRRESETHCLGKSCEAIFCENLSRGHPRRRGDRRSDRILVEGQALCRRTLRR